MISKESETILYVIERLQKAAMPSEIPGKLLRGQNNDNKISTDNSRIIGSSCPADTLLVKTDLLAIDILIQENEFSIAYDEILRTEKEYEIVIWHVYFRPFDLYLYL